MTYVDGYVVPVPTAKKGEYLEQAKLGVTMFKKHGALNVVECWGDDVPDGKVTSLPMSVKLEPNETVVFSWVTWPDKATRDKAWKALMEDEEMKKQEMPFDGKRMIFGGFETLVEE